MKALNEKLQKGVRVFVFALVATASVGAALAMKPAERKPDDIRLATYKYGVTDNNDGINWRVEAYLDDPTAPYNCDTQVSTCTVTYDTQEPLSTEALIPKDEAENPDPGIFSMP